MRTRKETGVTLLRNVRGFKGNLKVSPGCGPGYRVKAGPKTGPGVEGTCHPPRCGWTPSRARWCSACFLTLTSHTETQPR